MQSQTCIFFLIVASIIGQTIAAGLPVGEAIEVTADRLEDEQITDPCDPIVGSWPDEADYTGSIVPGMVSAYELTCNPNYRASAELGGDYIFWAAHCEGNFYGDDLFALTRLSEIATDPCDKLWGNVVSDFYSNVKKYDVNSTEGYIAQYVEIDPSTAVFYLANHVVAAYFVNAEDKQIWREGLIDYLADVDDDSSYFPVMALGIATWALAQTGDMNSTPVDPNGDGMPYWEGVTLAELPGLLLSHQVPSGGHPRPGKVVQMILEYTGEGCDASHHNQEPDKVSCSGDPNGAEPVDIVVSDGSGSKIWGSATNASIGDLILADAANAGEDRLDSSTLVTIYDVNGNIIQEVIFHTSGSVPLNIGDQFGSMLVVSLTTDKGVFPGGWFYWRFDHARAGKPLKEAAGYTEDTIFGTLGLVAAFAADPSLDLEDPILVARQALLEGIDDDGKVYEHLSLKGKVYYTYAGEMLQALGELAIPGDLDLDGGVNFVDYAIFANWWGDSGCDWCSCWCARADLDHDGDVDYDDLEIFVDYWLKGMSY